MPRRAWGSGSLYLRQSDQRWVGSVSDGRGGRRYVTGKDRAEVSRRLRELVRSARSRRPSDQPTADYLDRWHRDARKRLRPQTWEMYASVLRTHIIPWCGKVPLGKLRPDDVEAMLTGMMDAGLSPQRAKHAHVVLRAALSDAVLWDLVPVNVAKSVKSPRVVLKHPPTIEPAEAMRFLETLKGHPYRTVYVLGMFAGMRQGEILALDWSDLDFAAGVIHVRHTLRYVPRSGGEDFAWDEPKTPRSVRDLPMSALVRAELEKHKHAATSVSMVFARWDGRPLLRQDVTRKWRLALSAAGHTDAEVAAAVELPLFTVRGILTNPIHIGRLRDGTAARVGATIEPGLWNASARHRAHRATNTGQPAYRSRDYALRGIVVCDACEQHLTGDTGYYRHHDACDAFHAATDGLRRRPVGKSVSVPASDYDGATRAVLGRLALRADAIARTVSGFRDDEVLVDHVALARVEQQRTAAMERYRRDRDASALERAMATLDHHEATARIEAPTLTPYEVREYLTGLPSLWADAPESRGLLVGALFERVRAMGTERLRFDWSPEAIALGIADGMPASAMVSVGSGRGERSQARTYRLTFHGGRGRMAAARTA